MRKFGKQESSLGNLGCECVSAYGKIESVDAEKVIFTEEIIVLYG